MVQRQSLIAQWCERIMEGGWLLAVVLIPSYFNLLSSRHFEPDKATALRAIVLVMAAAGIIRWLDQLGATPRPASDEPSRARPSFWRRLTAVPLGVPVLVYVAVFLFATIFSVAPYASFWGSYQRLQGTYTNLSYVLLGVLIALNLRRHEQLERLITMIILGSLVAIGYGLVQHFQVDPLPWRGDVVSRVASTMGNSIFVAAYLILVVPLALYRVIVTIGEARRASAVGQPAADWGWALVYLLLILGSLAMTFAALKFAAVVRTNDLRYWWLYPGALLVGYLLYLVPTLQPHRAERINIAVLLPGLLAVGYVLLVGMAFQLGQAAGAQEVRPSPGRGGLDWPIWLVGGLGAVIVAYVLLFILPRRAGPPSALFLWLQSAGMLAISLLLLVTIFFTQSRGPWLGIGAGLFVFFTSLLWQAYRHARRAGASGALWRNLLISEIVLMIALAAFIVAFNFSNAPVFEELRKVPYVGRMGLLLDTRPGTTGDVRMKIWFGDDKGGGAVGLITSDPVRTLIGWGPESMFMAYNRFYPPSLANVEARGASPDRSHQAYLDELVTKGVLGLLSYLFVLVSFLALARRLLRDLQDWRSQVLVLAGIAIIVSHSVEGLTGIPIVATLMLLWVTIAIVWLVGALAGQYALQAAPEPVAAAPEPVAAVPAASPAARGRGAAARGRGRGAAARGAAQAAPRRRSSRESNPAGLLVYALIAIVALVCTWMLNVDNVYADMRFQQGQTYAESAGGGLEQQLVGMDFFIDAIRMEPEQDFYYLSLGRNLMSIADIRRQTPNTPLGQPDPQASLNGLLRLHSPQEAQTFVLNQSVLGLMSYAQAVLERAYAISPLNKDHSANLARMHKFWYSRLQTDPKQLEEAIHWYEVAHGVAPQDVVILNEYAGTLAQMGDYVSVQQSAEQATPFYDQSEELLSLSKSLDPRYRETDVLVADLQRTRGNVVSAVDQYLALLAQDPHALDSQFDQLVPALADEPEQLKRLLESYKAASDSRPEDAVLLSIVGRLARETGDIALSAQAYGAQVQLQPESMDARQNYTFALSDTARYADAAVQAQALLQLVQQQGETQQVQDMAARVQGLINFLNQRAAGG